MHGQFGARGNDASFNSRNPILAGPQPSYHSYDLNDSISGPVSRYASYFFSVFSRNHQNTNIVDATDPSSITALNPNGVLFNEPFSNPNSRLDITPRIDWQLGQSNTLTFWYDFPAP